MKFDFIESATPNITPNTYNNNEFLYRTETIKTNSCTNISFPANFLDLALDPPKVALNPRE